MGIGTAIAPGRSHQTPGPRHRDPLLGGQKETVSPGFISNSLESGGIKTGIIDLLPHTKEQHRVFIFQPLHSIHITTRHESSGTWHRRRSWNPVVPLRRLRENKRNCSNERTRSTTLCIGNLSYLTRGCRHIKLWQFQ